MICHRSSLMRQSYHFTTDFNGMLLQLVDVFSTLNIEWAADIYHWNIDEKLCKVWLVIPEYSTCMFIWKVNFKVQTVARVKTYQLVQRNLQDMMNTQLLTHKVWKTGLNSYYHCCNIEVFLGDCFYWHTLYMLLMYRTNRSRNVVQSSMCTISIYVINR